MSVRLLCQIDTMTRRAPKAGDRCGNEDCPYHDKDIPSDHPDVYVVNGVRVYCSEFCLDEWEVGD